MEMETGNGAKKYGTIYADPPWPLRGGKNGKRWGKFASPDSHYPLMKFQEIQNLKVPDLCLDNSVLWLWVVSNFLQQGLDTMEAWGFRYITNIVWHKEGPIGLGQYVRTKHELCLFGIRGKIPPKFTTSGKRIQIPSVFMIPKSRHSRKPDQIRSAIREFSPGPYLEMFAREKSEGWDTWGNEVSNDVNIAQITQPPL